MIEQATAFKSVADDDTVPVPESSPFDDNFTLDDTRVESDHF